MSQIAGLILAAGKGTRMKSDLPKALFRVCGVPMVDLVGRAMRGVGIQRPTVVVGHKGQMLIDGLPNGYDFEWQTEQLGTGHAVLMAAERYRAFEGTILVVPGDVPLLSSDCLRQLIDHHTSSQSLCTVATMKFADPTGYGRIVRDLNERVTEIVEEKDATPEQRSIQEVNSGVYCFDSKTLFATLPQLSSQNAQGEYYLTDVVKLIASTGGVVETCVFADHDLLRGVNDRWQLAEAAHSLRMRMLRQLCLDGVTVVDPATTFIDVDVEVGAETVIHPMTTLTSGTRIGEGCEIGPNALIDKSAVGNFTSVNMSRVNEAIIGSNCKVGPFAHIRPGANIGDHVKIGNFVEIKKSDIADRAAVSHLTYIGDSSIGEGSNIGAGTITCNYDGFAKHRTEIGANAFIGSNSTLVAPLVIGNNVMVAAGSVITKDVPAEALALGRSKQENKEGWVPHWRKRKTSATVSQ
jgi:bifunctional UDP-N-acetylglucosamine pyrophosphorylase/glucosamine-1-phosphate N-acetyltransferase